MARREFQNPSILERETPKGVEYYIRYRVACVKAGPDGRPQRDKEEKWHALGLKKEGPNAKNTKALTLHQAERMKAEIMREVNGQVYTIQAHIPFQEFLRVYEDQFVPGLKVPTQITYRQWIRLYIKPYFGEKRLCDIKPVDCQVFFGGLCRTKNLKDGTVERIPLAATTKNSIKGILASVFEQARIWGYWQQASPVVFSTGRRTKARLVREKRIPTPEQVRQILDVVDEQRQLIIETLMWTGVRISECLGLKPEAFDVDRGIVKITERQCRRDVDTPKSEESVRAVPLGNLTDRYRALLKDAKPGEFIFLDARGRPYRDCELLSNYLTPRLVKLGLKWPGFGWHTFRRALATWMDQNGASVFEIMQQLGHSDPKTTRLYVVGSVGRRGQIVTQLQEKFANSAG